MAGRLFILQNLECGTENVNYIPYIITNDKKDMTDIKELKLNIKTTGANLAGTNGYVTLGLVSEMDATEYVIKNQTTLGFYNGGEKTVILDTSEINGEYYIKVSLTKTEGEGNLYIQDNGSVIGTP